MQIKFQPNKENGEDRIIFSAMSNVHYYSQTCCYSRYEESMGSRGWFSNVMGVQVFPYHNAYSAHKKVNTHNLHVGRKGTSSGWSCNYASKYPFLNLQTETGYE